MTEDFKRLFDIKALGPITVGAIIKGFLILFLGVFLIGMGLQYYKQIHLGTGWRLMDAIKKHYDEARGLILDIRLIMS
ncbi:MAG TPA: hypothetical protein DDW65_18650 [Firmicutes bacterium]|jgi:hypothetical protein|nr:hypothetical protein [Bacillota bacterium]